MIRLCVREFEKLTGLPATARRQLERFDNLWAGAHGTTVFDWRWRHAPKAKSLCGVIELPGLSVEILPKIAESSSSEENDFLARKNLLYMMVLAGALPFEERDIAHFSAQKRPLFEALIAAFANRLRAELARGVERTYVVDESNKSFIKGKLLFGEQIRRNSVTRHLNYVRYDDHQVDIQLNRVLRSVATILRRLTRSDHTRSVLSRSELDLADVSRIPLTTAAIDGVHYTRNMIRFQPLVEFARLVVHQQIAGMSAGQSRTFSLLFPMERVFEGFVGNLIRRDATLLGFERSEVRLQSHGDRRHLLQDDQGRGRFQLRPDVVILRKDEGPTIVLDTKWKHLRPGATGIQRSIGQQDAYQLFAYSERYLASRNVLLYPKVAEASNMDYEGYNVAPLRRFCVRFLDLSYDLRRNKKTLRRNIAEALVE